MDEIYSVWLSELKGLSYAARRVIKERSLSPEQLFPKTAEELRGVKAFSDKDISILADKDISEAERIINDCARQGIKVLGFGEEDYPRMLADTADPPLALYVKGKLPDTQDIPAIALVGTRNPSEYGLKMAERIGSQLAEEGALIVSGLSSGIESAGARSALSAGGTVIAVLGTEIAKAPRDYSEKICKKGALVSEYAPGTKTQKSFFRARNRIGSGLSAGVVAIEAPLGSGTLLYVAEAIEQGRDIFAVPGNADSPKSEGTNEMIKNGAKAVTCGNDIMEEYRIRYKGRLKALPANTDKTPDLSPALKHGDKSVDKKEERGYIDLSDYLKSLSVNQLAIISAIESPGTGVDDIIERSGLPAASVLSDLTILQIKGFVIQESGKRFTLNFKK